MSEITELERRISAALDRIDKGVDALTRMPPEAGAAPSDAADDSESGAQARTDELAQLRAALEAERSSNAELTERVRALRERQDTAISGLERRLARATEQLDVQGLELRRMKKANAELVAVTRALRAEGGEDGPAEADLLSRSMSAELEALRAERRAEAGEMEEILAALDPLITEAENA